MFGLEIGLSEGKKTWSLWAMLHVADTMLQKSKTVVSRFRHCASSCTVLHIHKLCIGGIVQCIAVHTRSETRLGGV